jgi:phage host-nuclease inhibitor protein Gam
MTTTYSADQLVAVYIKIRDAKDAITRKYEAQVEELSSQMAMIEAQLLELCKSSGQDGGRTQHGTFTRTVKTRYWTNDWKSMREFIQTHNALDLLEQRIHQTNMKQFLTENPGVLPKGLNADSRYAITVRRPTSK